MEVRFPVWLRNQNCGGAKETMPNVLLFETTLSQDAAMRRSSLVDGHHTLTIENNVFLDNNGVQLVLDGLKNTIVRRNSFFNAQHKINNRGANHGIDGRALVYINRAHSLTLEGNRAWKLGTAHKRRLQITNLATQITGILDGVIVENSKLI
jgi:hypothetical protein